MGQITRDQSLQIMATLMTNASWDEVDFEDSGPQDLIICDSKEAGRQFTNFLKNGGRTIINVSQLPTWKTIRLGIGLKNANQFRKEFKKRGCNISDWANDIMDKKEFSVAKKEIEAELVIVSVSELGFKGRTTRKDIYNKAIDLGLQLCPPEVGPQLRLQYLDQPKGEWLWIAMESITGSGGTPHVFSVVRDYDRDVWLSTNYSEPDDFWDADGHWVFCRRK